MTIAYRGEGHAIQPGCTLKAHYAQVQAVCDALGFAAQQLQAHGVEVGNDSMINYWYGVFQGYRGLLRALEGNTGELEQVEQDMLARIDWDAEVPHFVVPGFEHVSLQDQHLPGEGQAGV